MVEPSNLININNIKDKTLDFSEILENNKSLVIKRCSDMIIIVGSKINKITIQRSQRILLVINKLISGIEINNSKYIVLETIENVSTIPVIELFYSTLFLYGPIEKYLNILINADRSEVCNITSL